MERSNYSQLELFSASKGISKAEPRLSSSFLSRIWGFERIILLMIGFIITGVISFSLGVEKGRHLAMLPDVVREISQPAIQKPKAIEESPKAIEASPKIKEPTIGYTIQVASYQTKTLAQKEMEILKQKGLLSLILTKGSYTVVCVGHFSNREMAKSILTELKKRYRDCYIRRL